MVPQLRPLLLPQLVEEEHHHQQQCALDLQQDQPQHQQQRRSYPDDSTITAPVAANLPYASYTNNSSSSDIVSPVTPTFSAKGHFRGSSSSSSLDLSFSSLSVSHDSPTPPQKQLAQQQQPQPQPQPQPQQTLPALQSPVAAPTQAPLPASQPLSKRSSNHQLPDVAEEPLERDDEPTIIMAAEHDALGLYSCLCDEPCDHRKSTDKTIINDLLLTAVTDAPDFDYDAACLSDVDMMVSPSRQSSASRRPDLAELTSMGLTSRLGPRFNASMDRWRASRRGRSSSHTPNGSNGITSPSATDISCPDPAAAVPSSRSSSISAANRNNNLLSPAYGYPSVMASAYDSVDSFDSFCGSEYDLDDSQRAALERDRAKATTPLLPPLMMESSAPEPPLQSPLQSPSIAPPSTIPLTAGPVDATAAPYQTTMPPLSQAPNFSRPSLSTRPSTSSLRRGFSHGNSIDLPTGAAAMAAGLPAILQEHDEWSDRLGHANFTITPQPYEPETVDEASLAQFRQDWDAARTNYTKHLVRTGENYGETSKIYGLTEAKWAETEARWRAIHHDKMAAALGVTSSEPRGSRNSGSGSGAASRAQSRGRGRSGTGAGRGRSDSASAVLWSAGMSMGMRSSTRDDAQRGHMGDLIEDSSLPLPASAVPRMLSAEGKFPSRGDEDIVGPMHRAHAMERSKSEEKYGAKFWKNLAGKVLRR